MPSLEFERAAAQETGVAYIAGLDEAGRGAIAGPVVAAAVILPLDDKVRLDALRGVNDSKQLTSRMRARFFSVICENAVSYGVGSVEADGVDEMGIIQATKQAMTAALNRLEPAAGYLLIDGRIRLQALNIPQRSLIRGDSKSLSIAAASILAKVTRDAEMVALDGRFPEYGFAQHKGYGTPAHLEALRSHGPSPIHRRTFAPLRLTLV